jgi:hypothetical protein
MQKRHVSLANGKHRRGSFPTTQPSDSLDVESPRLLPLRRCVDSGTRGRGLDGACRRAPTGCGQARNVRTGAHDRRGCAEERAADGAHGQGCGGVWPGGSCGRVAAGLASELGTPADELVATSRVGSKLELCISHASGRWCATRPCLGEAHG